MPPTSPTARPPDPLAAALRRSGLVRRGERILVAFSGGPDSTALLVALAEEGHDLIAAHFDHALQPASAQCAEQARSFCAELGVPLVIERRTRPLASGSVQAAARAMRYEFLGRAATAAGASRIALAHTADDVVEGAVMHLLRGCGIAGLRGMPAAREPFVRPLLNVWREEIDAFLQARGITALSDPANSDRRYHRVAVRRELIPALEAAKPGITRRLHAVALRAASLQAAVERAAGLAVDGRSVAAGALGALPEPVAVEVLELLYRRAGGARPALGRLHLAAMLGLARGGRGGRGLDLPGGRRFRVVDSRAEIVTRVTHSMEARLEVKECSGCPDREAVHLARGLSLSLGARRPGLRIRARAGSRKLQDVFVDAKVPREDRDGWPVVFSGERVAWVPGLALDHELQARDGEPALHVTVTRILSAGMPPKKPVLESPDSPRGESS